MAGRRKRNNLTLHIPLPMCIVNSEGKVTFSNDHIGDVFLYNEIADYDFFVLTGIKVAVLRELAEEGKTVDLERNDRIFELKVSFGDDEQSEFLVIFNDVTELRQLKERYEEERVCVARVDLDNVEEMEASLDRDVRLSVTSDADKLIRNWASRISGSIINNKDNEYIIYFSHGKLEEVTRNRFAILDEIREIETGSGFPVSISIGVGAEGKDIRETRERADMALDLAMGRGGDQAVVNSGERNDFYGGRMQSVEKGNKGKSRVVAHALRRLIDKTSRIMIMGHSNPDMDAFGSALGMFRVCQLCGKNASIVIGEPNDSLQLLYRKARELGIYTFISHEQALKQINEDTLLIVLDVHRPTYTECPELIKKTENVVVIDHHRRAADAIQNPILSYIESYASSTAELVTEILQYTAQAARKSMKKLEAEALLAGMTVDTNRFAIKTGVRTFEAAAWLRRAGADTTEVKKLFQENLDDFKIRAKALGSAVIRENGIATSICAGFNEEAQIINSQVADELLNIRGIRASFVAGMDDEGRTVVSARSLGDVNVQIIMERMGGGGHLTTAGTQIDESPEEAIQIIEDLLESMERN